MEVLKKESKGEKWLLCPACGKKTRDRIREDTILINYPLYCPKCGQTTTICAKKLLVEIVKEKADA